MEGREELFVANERTEEVIRVSLSHAPPSLSPPLSLSVPSVCIKMIQE